MSDVLGLPPPSWIPVGMLVYNDVTAGDYNGLVIPPNFCGIITDADVYCVGAVIPADGLQLYITDPETDIQVVFYSHLDATGSAHWQGFQKLKEGLCVGFRVLGSSPGVASAYISGYLLQDYTLGEGY